MRDFRPFLTRLLLCMAATLCLPATAQTFCGEHKYDGEHKNEVSGYIVGGRNVVTGVFGGMSASYKRHLTDRWSVEGDMQAQFGKQLYGAFVKGGYRLPWKYFNFYFDGKMMYNRYHRFGTNEYTANISATVEAPYFEVTIGESAMWYRMLGDGYNEPLTFTFGFGLNVRPRWNSWNIGLFFRNYDEYYYENWNINWGLRFNANLTKRMRLFGEFNIRPAGSMSQLASKYEFSQKFGLKYVW